MSSFLSATTKLLRKLPALLLLFSVAAGCRSAQPAYLFQPSSQLVHPTASGPAAPGAVAAQTTAVPMPLPTAPRKQSARLSPGRHAQAVRRLQTLRRVYAQAARARVRPIPAQAATQEARRVASPRHRMEVGLGTTVLGVLGLVVLPVALLGLLIWGGPVWAILAGLAALAVLIAYLDPFA